MVNRFSPFLGRDSQSRIAQSLRWIERVEEELLNLFRTVEEIVVPWFVDVDLMSFCAMHIEPMFDLLASCS